MKHSLFPSLIGAGGLALSLFYTAPASAIATFSVEPAATGALDPGSSFSVDVKVSNVGEVMGTNDIIRAYELLLGYDASVLTANSVTFGNYLGTGAYDASTNPSGQYLLPYGTPDLTYDVPTSYTGPHDPTMTVDFGQTSILCGFASESPDDCPLNPSGPYLIDLQPSAFVLATFNFTVKADTPTGTTWLTLIDNSLISDDGERFFDVKGNSSTDPIMVALYNGQVDVPEPGTLVLLLTAGLIGGGRTVLRRRLATRGAALT